MGKTQEKIQRKNHGRTRKAWILVPDYTSYDIGEVSREEIERIWGARWAQKCIRDVSEEVALARFSPVPKPKAHDFCSPQLVFENGDATLAVSPFVDVKPAVLYGAPLGEFSSWTVFLSVRRGRRLFGLLPLDFRFETVVSPSEALDLVRLFYDHQPEELVFRAKQWKDQVSEHYRYRMIAALFL